MIMVMEHIHHFRVVLTYSASYGGEGTSTGEGPRAGEMNNRFNVGTPGSSPNSNWEVALWSAGMCSDSACQEFNPVEDPTINPNKPKDDINSVRLPNKFPKGDWVCADASGLIENSTGCREMEVLVNDEWVIADGTSIIQHYEDNESTIGTCSFTNCYMSDETTVFTPVDMFPEYWYEWEVPDLELAVWAPGEAYNNGDGCTTALENYKADQYGSSVPPHYHCDDDPTFVSTAPNQYSPILFYCSDDLIDSEYYNTEDGSINYQFRAVCNLSAEAVTDIFIDNGENGITCDFPYDNSYWDLATDDNTSIKPGLGVGNLGAQTVLYQCTDSNAYNYNRDMDDCCQNPAVCSDLGITECVEDNTTCTGMWGGIAQFNVMCNRSVLPDDDYYYTNSTVEADGWSQTDPPNIYPLNIEQGDITTLSMNVKRYFHSFYDPNDISERSTGQIPVNLIGINPPHIHFLNYYNEKTFPIGIQDGMLVWYNNFDNPDLSSTEYKFELDNFGNFCAS